MAALGDIIFRGASVWLRLVGNITTTRKFLRQVGDATNSAAPVWDQVTDADLSTTDITTNDVSITKHGFAPKAPNNTTTFLRGDATYATPAGGGDTFVWKTADETVNNSTTLQNDDELLFAVDANSTYWFEMTLMLSAPTTAADWKYAFTAPASATMFYGPDVYGGSVQWNEATPVGTNPQILKNVGSTLVSGGTDLGIHGIRMTGFVITAGTSGTVQFQWAQNSLVVGNSIVKANSFIRYRKRA